MGLERSRNILGHTRSISDMTGRRGEQTSNDAGSRVSGWVRGQYEGIYGREGTSWTLRWGSAWIVSIVKRTFL